MITKQRKLSYLEQFIVADKMRNESPTPTPPPGYVFVSNNSFGKEEKEIHEGIGRELRVPVEDFLTMKGVDPLGSYSSTFVLEKHGQKVKDWIDGMRHELITMARLYDALEEAARVKAGGV